MGKLTIELKGASDFVWICETNKIIEISGCPQDSSLVLCLSHNSASHNGSVVRFSEQQFAALWKYFNCLTTGLLYEECETVLEALGFMPIVIPALPTMTQQVDLSHLKK